MSDGISKIWILVGSYFALPVNVISDPNGPSRVTVDAIPLLQCQIKSAKFLLHQFATGYGVNGYLVYEAILRKTAFPMPKDQDPERYVRWNPFRARFKGGHPRAGNNYEWDIFKFSSPDIQEFVDEFWQKNQCRLLTSKAQATYLWNAFLKQMFHRLVNQQKVVDLGFIKLHPLPLRANWKECLMSLETLTPRLHYRRSAEDRDRLNLNKLINPKLLTAALRRKKSATTARVNQWTVEVEFTRHWFDAIDLLEQLRYKHKLGRYWIDVYETLRRKAKDILRIYYAYQAATRLPYPQVPRRWAIQRKLPPQDFHWRGKGIHTDVYCPDSSADNRKLRAATLRAARAILQAAKRLSKVPRVPKGEVALRDTGQGEGGPDDWSI